MPPSKTSLLLMWSLYHYVTSTSALTGGWLETDPTWVTSDVWGGQDGVQYVAGYVLDFNLNTGWKRAPEEGTWWLTFDLQTPKTLSRIRLVMERRNTPDVTVLRSTTAGRRWNVVKEFNDLETLAGVVDLSGFLSTGQHWRLEFTSLTSQTVIYEIMFFEDGNCDVYDVICDGAADCDDGSDEVDCDQCLDDMASVGTGVEKEHRNDPSLEAKSDPNSDIETSANIGGSSGNDGDSPDPVENGCEDPRSRNFRNLSHVDVRNMPNPNPMYMAHDPHRGVCEGAVSRTCCVLAAATLTFLICVGICAVLLIVFNRNMDGNQEVTPANALVEESTSTFRSTSNFSSEFVMLTTSNSSKDAKLQSSSNSPQRATLPSTSNAPKELVE
uniref:F5/8 type C domain-containing protein n=1 Tax=Branchiostoma floridae TaxID=7739 RepID=C3YB46_BRAFL|eukprot:XP_002606498.1 hypothetical protein BRAFLDRAFT_91919 [Branchiostoma floridae]